MLAGSIEGIKFVWHDRTLRDMALVGMVFNSHLQDRLELINDHLKMLLLRAGLGTQYVTSSAPAAATAGQPRTA